MRILFIGDIMGRSGREALQERLPVLKEALQPDVIIVNGENAASGAGITRKICAEFYEWGVDVITTGNHVFDQREILGYINGDKNLLRPLNYPPGAPGRGVCEFTLFDGRKIIVMNAMARVFMQELDCPFQATEALLGGYRLGQNVQAIFMDLHGETTSEKMAFAHYFGGRISAVIGTHTHIPTADAHVMKSGTAFMADAGMTGDYDSVIGVEPGIPIHRFLKKTPTERFKPASGEATLCGALVVTDDATGLALDIQPIRQGGMLAQAMPSSAA